MIRPGISVLYVARAASERLLVALEHVRPVADELVVALDDRGIDSAGIVEGVADTLMAFPFLDAIERQWAWIVSHCTREWVLWLDDDELPSEGLVGRLPELARFRDVTHYQVRRRWIAPSGDAYLAEPPWAPEFVPRLFRPDSGTTWFPGVLHLPVKIAGAFRWIDEPILHTDLAISSEERRRRKAAAYERRRPGLRIAGRPLNEAFYVPESRPTADTVALEERERELVRRFLAAGTQPPSAPPRGTVVRGSREDVDRLFRGAAAGEGLYDARLEVPDGAVSFRAGVERPLELWVENRSNVAWPQPGMAELDIRLSYRWQDAAGAVVVADGLRTGFPAALRPGEKTLVVADVEPPDDPGRYTLTLDLVHEHVRWFGAAVSLEVAVAPVRTIGVVADDELAAADVAATVTESAPEARCLLLAGDPATVERRLGYATRDDPSRQLFSDGRRLRAVVAAARGRALARPSGAAGLRGIDTLVVPGAAAIAGHDGTRRAWQVAALVLSAHAQGANVLFVDVGLEDLQTGLRGWLPRRALAAGAAVPRDSLPGLLAAPEPSERRHGRSVP